MHVPALCPGLGCFPVPGVGQHVGWFFKKTFFFKNEVSVISFQIAKVVLLTSAHLQNAEE